MTFSGIQIDVNPAKSNADSLIVLTLSGMVIDSKILHPENENSSIEEIPSGIFTKLKLKQPKNAFLSVH